MHSRLLAFIGLAGLLMASPVVLAADAGCCGEKAACCEKAADHAGCDMPCCANQLAKTEANAVDIFFAMQQPAAAPVAATPARQATVVWFMQATKVGDQILQGRYVIEHDNDRMARGEPCTHIYAYNDLKNPVVAFHCTHLEREASTDNTVLLHSTGDGYKKFVEFQFAGETAAHGFPTVR
jgi:hypothetical protein